MLDLLEVRVTITVLTTCETCEGRQARGRGGGVACPTCRAMRRVPQLRIEGMVLDRLGVGEAEWVRRVTRSRSGWQ